MKVWVAIVDDNIEHLRVCGKLLSEAGIKVSTLKNRSELAGFLVGNTPDMIFFDASNPTALLAKIQGSGESSKEESAFETDSLTGLMESFPLQNAISQKLEVTSGVVLFISIEGFELIDELYGEDVGDRLLKRFAEVLSSVLRSTDPIGRVGRNRFMGFGEHIRKEIIIAEKREHLNDTLKSIELEELGEDHPLPLNVLIGAVVCPDEGRDYLTISKKVDEALYKASEMPDKGYSFFWSTRHPDEKTQVLMGDEVVALLSEREIQKGAYLLPFEQFRTICRLLIRIKNYHQIDALLIRFTMEGIKQDGSGDRRADNHFIKIAAGSLRTSDVMTRRGGNRCCVLLTYTKEKYGQTVAERIVEKWNNSEYADEGRVTYDIHIL